VQAGDDLGREDKGGGVRRVDELNNLFELEATVPRLQFVLLILALEETVSDLSPQKDDDPRDSLPRPCDGKE
jgi:hypothetical protein